MSITLPVILGGAFLAAWALSNTTSKVRLYAGKAYDYEAYVVPAMNAENVGSFIEAFASGGAKNVKWTPDAGRTVIRYTLVPTNDLTVQLNQPLVENADGSRFIITKVTPSALLGHPDDPSNPFNV